MQTERYVDQVQTQLAAAGALGDDSTRAIVEALVTAAGPAIRLALLAAGAALADEITAALLDTPGAPVMSVRLDGDDLRAEVRHSDPAGAAGDTAAGDTAPGDTAAAGPDDAENTARISLRLPNALKVQVETAARQDGVSINTWIVRAASSALPGSGRGTRRASGHNHRVTGWING
jgi:hypothetical protein